MSNRAVMVIPILALAVMACAIQFAGNDAQADSIPSVSVAVPTEKIRIGITSFSPPEISHITSAPNVRLRSLPDAAGPTDSIELTLLHPGDEFQVSSCKQVNGQWWAYGTFNSMIGWVSADFIFPNVCEP